MSRLAGEKSFTSVDTGSPETFTVSLLANGKNPRVFISNPDASSGDLTYAIDYNETPRNAGRTNVDASLSLPFKAATVLAGAASAWERGPAEIVTQQIETSFIIVTLSSASSSTNVRVVVLCD